jgi:arylsulfatase A
MPLLRRLLRSLPPLLAGLGLHCSSQAAETPPNFIIVFADDLGYGDLGCHGHPSIRTPHLDRMAAEGVRFTDFYTAAAVCTPSRAALLTGRHALRSGMTEVLFPHSPKGLPATETTLASVLSAAGYATAMIGKWHLGIHEGSRPQDHGFARTFGLPYSNDMDRREGIPGNARLLPDPPADGWNVPLLDQGVEIERPAQQSTLTRRYTEEAISFIRTNRKRPFFLYLAHSMPHTPLFRSPEFAGRSPRGLYGDVIEELDASTGEILEALRQENLASRTFVLFTSDNGPWLSEKEQGGSAGLLRGGKAMTWEGGMRVPGIAWMPGRIPPALNHTPVSTLDLFPTILTMAGQPPPKDLTLDGHDLGPTLAGTGTPPEDRVLLFFRGKNLHACRIGPWKAHFVTEGAYGMLGKRQEHDPPLLFHLGHDPSESHNRAAENPEIVEQMRKAYAAALESFAS